LLLGSNRGHVECIDIASGRSQWMYVFPAIYRTMSFSTPRGLPPRMATQARLFRELNRRPPDLTGMILLPDDAGFRLDGDPTCPGRGRRPATKIVPDPRPTDPYRDLPKLLALSWAVAALLPVIFLIVLCHTPGKPKALPGFTALGLLCLIAIAGTLMVIGRVADSTCLALKVSVVFTSVLLLVSIGGLYAQRRWLGATFALVLSGIIVWRVWPAILYA
jgi:hypothetical protein